MNRAVNVPNTPPVELRAAVRFPLRIPISVSTSAGEVTATTVNISASGILFEVERGLEIGSSVSFTIPMPAQAMGTQDDVVVRCAGRVVRCTRGDNASQVAAVIDKYYFSH